MKRPKHSHRRLMLACLLAATLLAPIPALFQRPSGPHVTPRNVLAQRISLVHAPQPVLATPPKANPPPNGLSAISTPAINESLLPASVEPPAPTTVAPPTMRTVPQTPSKPREPRHPFDPLAEPTERFAIPTPFSSDEVVQGNVAGWARGNTRTRDNYGIEMCPGLTATAHNLGAWFIVSDAVMVAATATGGSPSPGPTATALCFGSCGQSHEAGSLMAIAEIEHDDKGQPDHWYIIRNSGDRRFDEAALVAIADTARQLTSDAFSDSRKPRWTRWAFTAEAYRWSRADLLLDPQFTAPGRDIESQSGVSGRTTVTKKIRLIAMAYQGAEPTKAK